MCKAQAGMHTNVCCCVKLCYMNVHCGYTWFHSLTYINDADNVNICMMSSDSNFQ